MDIRKLVTELGGGAEVARLLGVTPQAVSNMAARGSIPPGYWPALIRAADKRGLPGVSAEALMKLAARNASKLKASA